ncbi:hypothetical protein ACSTDZ_22825, partial [Vibrio vulnificus]|uniref:hypothetical protein n=1 Tax=Vibrio vulnificus TaxID=672 RepID=UPI003ED9BBCA
HRRALELWLLNELSAHSAGWILHHARASLSKMTGLEGGVWGGHFKRQLSVKRPINTLSPPPVIPASLSAT